jgi:ADP-heptose:LPS heptosyltransferase
MKLRGNPKLKSMDRLVLGTLIWLFRRLIHLRPIPPNPTRVLLIKLNAIGDTLLFLALARIIKELNPAIRVDYLGSELNRPVLERCPYIDHLHLLELSRLLPRPTGFFSLVSKLRRTHYSVAIDGSQWARLPALTALLSGAETTIGFDTPGYHNRTAAFRYTVPHRREGHEIDSFLSLLKPLGIRPEAEDRRGEYHVSPEDRRRLETLSLPPSPWIVMHPGCGYHGRPRQWPVVNYIELARRLMASFPESSIILTGQGVEADLCTEINLGAPVAAHNFANRLDFHLTGALLEKSSLLICGNTGIMHLGAALDIPLVALHGPTDSRQWGPLSGKAVVIRSRKSCAPCLYVCDDFFCVEPSCMKEISVEEVFEACHSLLAGSETN